MFKHILIPTDGSPLSARAIKAGLRLAKETGARVTGYHAAEPAPTHYYGEGFAAGAGLVRELERRQQEAARKNLEPLERAARAAGVPFETVLDTPRSAYEGIVQAAKRHKCDAIVMASHGRRGIAGVLLGSVTQQVLSHSRIPVMVTR
jgi:nucleotide-binding universal stress UspA family protein